MSDRRSEVVAPPSAPPLLGGLIRFSTTDFPGRLAAVLFLQGKATEVLVQLKPGLLDPQGKAVEGSLPAMGWTNVSGVRVGRHVELTIEAESEEAAQDQVEEMAARLLSNPVIEEFQILRAEQVGR